MHTINQISDHTLIQNTCKCISIDVQDIHDIQNMISLHVSVHIRNDIIYLYNSALKDINTHLFISKMTYKCTK